MATASSSTTNTNKENDAQEIPLFKDFTRELLRTNNHHTIFSRAFTQNLSEKEKMTLILKYLKEWALLPFKGEDAPVNRKSAKVSVDLRNVGNAAFVRVDYALAISLYTRSIAAAPYPTSDEDVAEELGLAFGNRSAAYFRLGKYEASLRDIGRALDFKYPERLRYKLHERRTMCYKMLGRSQEAKASSQDTIHHVETSLDLTARKRKDIIKAMQTLCLAERCVQDGGVPDKPLPRPSYEQHELISCASSCVDLMYQPDKGRHFVANRNIAPGDILFVEKPFASTLIPEKSLTHCYKCKKRYDALIPCKTCDTAMYCSEECRAESWQMSHSIECRVKPALDQLDFTTNSCLALPLRMLLYACRQNGGILGLYRMAKALDADNLNGGEGIRGLDRKGAYNSSDYVTVHNLIQHHKKELPLQVICWCVCAAATLNCLEAYSDFFSCASLANESEDTVKLAKSFVAELLFKFTGIVAANSFAVTDFVTTVEKREAEDVDIGMAVYPTLSLLNHSCDPHASSSFHQGDVHVIMARQPIRKGDEICICYIDAYADKEMHERRIELNRRYFFDCKCIACINKWPEYDDLQSMNCPVFLCENCRTPLRFALVMMRKPEQATTVCTKCRKKYNLVMLMTKQEDIMLRLMEIFNQTKTGSLVDFTPELAGIVKKVDSFVQSPNQLTFNCQQYLRSSMKTTGNHIIQ